MSFSRQVGQKYIIAATSQGYIRHPSTNKLYSFIVCLNARTKNPVPDWRFSSLV